MSVWDRMPKNVFNPEASGRWHRSGEWSIERRAEVLVVNCPHGWSIQPGWQRPVEALAAHQAICPECRAVAS